MKPMPGGAGSGGELAMSAPEASSSPGSSSSGGGKRGRDHEDEVYQDNLHSHKRYLSEIMASSLNGLSVGDSLSENLMESPARSESMSFHRDDITPQYSPMSEDSDDCQYYDTPLHNSGSQTDAMSSPTTSPTASPHRFQKPHSGLSAANPYPLPSCSHSRRGSDSESRFPSPPNDMYHVPDLRRAALLRSVKMRVQCPQANDSLFSSGQEQEQGHHIEGVEGEDQRLSCAKSIEDEIGYQSTETCYRSLEQELQYIEDCSSADDGLSESKFNLEDGLSGPKFNPG